jgi:hypothetical protein
MTRPSSEPYYRRRLLPLSICSGKPTSTSSPTNELKTSLEEQNPHQRHRDATRNSNLTNAGRRGLEKRSTPPDRPPLTPEVDPMEENARWMTSSTPSARTTRTCAKPSGTAGTSSTPSGTADHSNPCRRPCLKEHLDNLDSPNSRKEEEMEHFHALTGRSTSSSADMGRKKARGNKSSTTVRYWWRPPVLPPCTDGLSTRSPLSGQISGSTSITRASTRSSLIR